MLQLPVTMPSTGLLIETGVWPANKRIEYSTLMLILSIINRNKERISQKIIVEQRNKGMPNTMYERAKEIGESIGMNIDQAVKMKKSTWKREAKPKIKKKIQQRLIDDLKEKTKARTIQKDKWLMKEYIENVNTDDIKDILKIRLHMQDVRKNYPKNDTDTIYPICRKEEDTTEHVLEVEFEKGKLTIGSSNKNHWKLILKIFRENKNKRKAQM